MSNSIKVDLVMDNGKVDQDASFEAFSEALSNFIAQHETETATLAAAVQETLAKHPGKGIKMPVLASLALNSINAQPENYSALETILLDYVRANSKGDNSPYVTAKGPMGGVWLRADFAAAQAAKAAAKK